MMNHAARCKVTAGMVPKEAISLLNESRASLRANLVLDKAIVLEFEMHRNLGPVGQSRSGAMSLRKPFFPLLDLAL